MLSTCLHRYYIRCPEKTCRTSAADSSNDCFKVIRLFETFCSKISALRRLTAASWCFQLHRSVYIFRDTFCIRVASLMCRYRCSTITQLIFTFLILLLHYYCARTYRYLLFFTVDMFNLRKVYSTRFEIFSITGELYLFCGVIFAR